MSYWPRSVLALCFLVASTGTNAAMESVPPVTLWCDGHTWICTYPTDIAAAKAQEATYNSRYMATNPYHAYIVVESCNGYGTCLYHVVNDLWTTASGPLYIRYVFPACPTPEVEPTVPYKYDYASKMCVREAPCLAPNAVNPKTGNCEPAETYTITLDQKSVTLEPSGTAVPNAKTFQIITATVRNQSKVPKAGARVTIKADVKQRSGGHDHTDSMQRPKGVLGDLSYTNLCAPNAAQPLACITGTADDKGEYRFLFFSPEVSGEHTVTATCDMCGGNEDKADVAVKVGGLVSLSAISADYVLVGVTATHSDNHYLTSSAKAIVVALAKQYHRKFPNDPLLHLNDASLKEGGVLDICTTHETVGGCASASFQNYVPMCQMQPNGTYSCSWARPHVEHRRGTVIDVRANNIDSGSANYATSIPVRNEQEFLRIARALRIGTGRDPHSPNSSNRHWHLRLLGAAE